MGFLDEALDKAAGVEPTKQPAAKKREKFPSGVDDSQRLNYLKNELETETRNLTHENPEFRKRAQANIDSIKNEIRAINPAFDFEAATLGKPVGKPEEQMVGIETTGTPIQEPSTSSFLEQSLDKASGITPTGVSPEGEKVLPPVEVTAEPSALEENAVGFGKNLAALLDNTVGGILPFVGKQGSYLLARSLAEIVGMTGLDQAGVMRKQSPEEIEALSSKLGEVLSQPIGKAFGLTDDPVYKAEPIGRFFEWLGENVNSDAKTLSKDLADKGVHVSENDIKFMMNMVLPKLVEKVGAPAGKVAEKAAEVVEPVVAPVASAASILREQLTPKRNEAGERIEPSFSGLQSAGAAAVPKEATIAQAMSVATPELREAIKNIPINKTNIPTLTRHIEADTLPIPIRLTEGQATGDIVKLSKEQNMRGKNPELAQRFNEQNNQLIENINAIREIAAPDVYGTKTIENSQAIIDAYKAADETRNQAIAKAYKELEDANGGIFPVDGVKMAKEANQLLAKKLKTEFVPAGIRRQLRRFESGEPMNFEQFEALRTNIAAEGRKAEKAGDGNAAMALSLVRQAMEDLPLPDGAGKQLKTLADNARSLAKQRFDLIKEDPAYKAAINDAVPADKFIDKFVINGHHKNIETMVRNLGENSDAHQQMAAGTINWLKDKAGIVNENGNFSQAGYNKALKKLDDINNLNSIFSPEASTQLKNLGNVARYTQFQPRGTFVSNSNTLVAALAYGAKAAETGANVMMGGKYGIPIGSIVREKAQEVKQGKEIKKSLEVGAGIKEK